ncbi:FCP1, TFIIF-interacting CTD phosphatase, NLI-interacting factor, partial [Pyrenophora tritici-repentis]
MGADRSDGAGSSTTEAVASGYDEKTPLLEQRQQGPYEDILRRRRWLYPRRISDGIVAVVGMLASPFISTGQRLIACFYYDEDGSFSFLAPVYHISRTFTRGRRKKVGAYTSRTEKSEKGMRKRRSSSVTQPQMHQHSRRSLSIASTSTAMTSDSESERGPMRDYDYDSPARNTRSRSSVPSRADEIAPAKRSIRITLHHNEDALRQRKAAKKAQSSKSNSVSPQAAASLKSPTGPATASSKQLTKFPRAPQPPRPLVPRRQPSYSAKGTSAVGPHQKTLIIDLDETLIHSIVNGGRFQTGHMVEVKLQASVGAGGQVIGPQVPLLYYVHKRPYCDDFLKKVSKWYNLIIFTASVQEYADPVIDWLEVERKYFAGRYYRQHCTVRNGAYIKDLAQVEPDLSKVMILDNSPLSYGFHPDNAIPIEGWISDPTDHDLLHLIPLLEGLQYVTDISSDYAVFLEKIADIFEAVAQIIPPYQQIYEVCKRNTFDPNGGAEGLHLAALMSYVYADLVQLCLDLYWVFCRGAQGSETHFLAPPTPWRPLDSRLVRLEARISQHKRWLQKETETHVQQYADVSLQRKEYLDFLQRQSEAKVNGLLDQEDQRVAKRLRRVTKVQSWLSSSGTVNVCDNIQQRHTNSTAWFLHKNAYIGWRDKPFDHSEANDTDSLVGNWQYRVLFVQAKAGFGKTTISQSVVENLVAEADDPDLCDAPPATASFHFSLLGHERTHPDDAFCSMACQLLQTHRHDRKTLDAICLLLRKTSFREHANADEVLDVLSLLLHQHPTFIVIDGADECSDTESLLSSLAKLCRVSDARVLLFSRPDMKIPLEYQKWASDAPHILPLVNKDNAAAINHCVVQDLNRMADQGFFGISMDRNFILQVAQSANGEFLWTSLLLKFLQSSLLSAEERLSILQNIQTLQGLESLYHVMLNAQARHSPHEKRIIVDVFRWLTFPIHHIGSAALLSALSTHDSKVSDITEAADIMHALPELTCGLLTVSHDTVAFSHASMRTYLQSPASQNSEFSLFDESSVHAHLAARCLSYLAHDVPQRPLGALYQHSPPTIPTPTSSGASQHTSASADSGYKSLSSSDGDNNPMTPPGTIQHSTSRATSIRTVPFDTHLPFLRYAALCWPIHLTRTLTPSPSPHHPTSASTATTLAYLPSLNAFLASRFAVTAWVEASYRYNLPPTLTRLVGPLSDLKAEILPSTIEGRLLRQVITEIRVLSEKLGALKREWQGVLRTNPSLIWQMEGVG